MRTRSYRLTVIGCALSWFLAGMHLPLVHQITHHGRAPHWAVLAVVSLVAVAALVTLWVLLRDRVRGTV